MPLAKPGIDSKAKSAISLIFYINDINLSRPFFLEDAALHLSTSLD